MLVYIWQIITLKIVAQITGFRHEKNGQTQLIKTQIVLFDEQRLLVELSVLYIFTYMHIHIYVA